MTERAQPGKFEAAMSQRMEAYRDGMVNVIAGGIRVLKRLNPFATTVDQVKSLEPDFEMSADPVEKTLHYVAAGSIYRWKKMSEVHVLYKRNSVAGFVRVNGVKEPWIIIRGKLGETYRIRPGNKKELVKRLT